MVDDGPADGRVDHQLPDPGDAGGRGADDPRGSGDHHTAVLLDSQRLSIRDHAAAALRLRHGQHRPEARVRDLRDRLVLRQHGARPRRQLAGAVRPAGAAGLCRGIGQSGRDEGHFGMVPRHRAWARRRLLQHGRVARLDACGAARCLGHPHAQLAVRVRPDRRDRARLGHAVAGVLSVSRETPGPLTGGTPLHPVR